MKKKLYFFIDDVIWVIRDLHRERPKSIFDNAFLKGLKEAHDKYGLKVQLNLFNRLDFYYGRDEFCLAEMTDEYKAEFEEASDWLKFGFHSRQEFPDYPYVNADYEDVKEDLDYVKREVFRFASKKNFAYACCPHWVSMSKEGCRALRDGGIRFLSSTHGDKKEYTGDPSALPYGHAGRLLQNKKPETVMFSRETRDVAISNSICGYNHITQEDEMATRYNLGTIYNEELDVHLKGDTAGLTLNLYTLDEVREMTNSLVDYEYVRYADHEQYFYKDYYAYQPDYMEKIHTAAKILNDNGFEHFFAEEIVD